MLYKLYKELLLGIINVDRLRRVECCLEDNVLEVDTILCFYRIYNLI